MSLDPHASPHAADASSAAAPYRAAAPPGAAEEVTIPPELLRQDGNLLLGLVAGIFFNVIAMLVAWLVNARPRTKTGVYLGMALGFVLRLIGVALAPDGAVRTEPQAAMASASQRLPEARAGFRTALRFQEPDRSPPEAPPPELFSLVRYRAPVGLLRAYVTPRPSAPGRRPAVLWLGGGFSNAIGPTWALAPRHNDQTASAFREAGVVLMLPSLRGGNDNPGAREGFLGEVDDVLAAAEHLASLDYVDPSRVYLGGHSTGATLALLVAESTDRFRAVFAFGPIDDVRGYGPEQFPVGDDPREVELRSPRYFLPTIRTPTWVFEGADGNADALVALQGAAGRAPVRFHLVAGADHFNLLRPVSDLLARKILGDRAPGPLFSLTDAEIAAARVPLGELPRAHPVGRARAVHLEAARVSDPRATFEDNLRQADVDAFLARVVALADAHLTARGEPFTVGLRMVLKADEPTEVAASIGEGAVREEAFAFVDALQRSDALHTRRDPIHLEVLLRVDPPRGRGRPRRGARASSEP